MFSQIPLGALHQVEGMTGFFLGQCHLLLETQVPWFAILTKAPCSKVSKPTPLRNDSDVGNT